MAAANFPAALAFVWRPGYDNPQDGYHNTPGDAGGGTKGGVIEASWTKAIEQGLVRGLLKDATIKQLSTVLQADFWGPTCDALPSGLDFAYFNGRMMSAGYPKLFQQVVGLTGDDVDGDVAGFSVITAAAGDPATLLRALTGVHYAYLTRLPSWLEFRGGWTKRLLDARQIALQLLHA
jgi:lysozyme family protein